MPKWININGKLVNLKKTRLMEQTGDSILVHQPSGLVRIIFPSEYDAKREFKIIEALITDQWKTR